MQGNSAGRDFLLGIVFFGTISALIYYTIVLTGFSFSEKYELSAYFENGKGLKEGDAVLVTGRPTGTVRRVEYLPERPLDRRILVTMEFDSEIVLHEGYEVRISEFTVLGGRVVEIEPGLFGAPRIPPDTEILGTVRPAPLETLGELVYENRDDFRAIVANLRQASNDLVQGTGPLGALFNDTEMRDNLDRVIAEAAVIAEDLRTGKGTIGMLIEDKDVRDRVTSLLNDGAAAAMNFRSIAEDLAAGRGTMGALMSDEAMRADTVALIENLRASTNSFRRVLLDAEEGRGLIGRVIADEEFAADAAEFMSNLEEITRRLVEGEGSLGRVFAEDEAYEEIMEAIRSINAQLEDAREAQPVSSFATMLFGNF